jgi:HPP family/Cyclic nucleotide-binding domain
LERGWGFGRYLDADGAPERPAVSEREQFLQRLALSRDLDAEELRALGEVAQPVQFPDSHFPRGRGRRLRVFATDRNGDETVVTQLKELEHVGEQSLLNGDSGRRNASVRACEDTTLLRIPKADFQYILLQRHTPRELLSETGRQQQKANAIRTARLARMWALFMFVNGFIRIAILAGLAKTFQTPFVFPSLGATAFLVFFTPTTPAASPRNTLCSHAVGVACGYGAPWATGLAHAGPAIVAELSWTRILAVSLALAATGASMILLNVPHPPRPRQR